MQSLRNLAHHICSFWSYLLVFMSNFCHVHFAQCYTLHVQCVLCTVCVVVPGIKLNIVQIFWQIFLGNEAIH